MVLVQVVDVLARDDVDFRVPVTIQLVEHRYLPLLLLGQLRKVLEYLFHAAKVRISERNAKFI